MTWCQRFLFNTWMMSEKVKFVLFLRPVLWYQYFTYFKKLLQWRKSRKTPEGQRFKLYAQSGPFESGDFANFGENGEKAPESWQFKLDAKVAPWRVAKKEKMAIWAKMKNLAQGLVISGTWQISKLDATWPLDIRNRSL